MRSLALLRVCCASSLVILSATVSACGATPTPSSTAARAPTTAATTVAEPTDTAVPSPTVGAIEVETDTGCFTVSGAGDEPWFDLQVVGTQFDAYEGARARVVVVGVSLVNLVDMGRFGVADAEIVDGEFIISMPQTLNIGFYTGIGLYIDQNGNDTCDDSEPGWGYRDNAVFGDLSFEVTLGDLTGVCVISDIQVQGFPELRLTLPCP